MGHATDVVVGGITPALVDPPRRCSRMVEHAAFLFSPFPSLTLGNLLCLYSGPGPDSEVNGGLVSLYDILVLSLVFVLRSLAPLFRQIVLRSPLSS